MKILVEPHVVQDFLILLVAVLLVTVVVSVDKLLTKEDPLLFMDKESQNLKPTIFNAYFLCFGMI
jgi:hypothetical protein